MSLDTLARMAASIRHRGPDGYGFFAGARVGLAHVRLSIVDVASGAQPMTNEDGRVVVVFNGEIYNYLELMAELRERGHRFVTHCDTEVLVHGWEEWGADLLHRLIGQFAFALYDQRTESVFLARDRFGVRPLFHAQRGGTLYFASEAKALFASGEVDARPDSIGLQQVFTFWAARAPRTPFAGVRQLEPGCCALWKDGQLKEWRYYELQYDSSRAEPKDAVEHLGALLESSVALRMRADVPVGGYLSGGLDSAIACTLAAQMSPYALRTFSVTFADPAFDESRYQLEMAKRVGSEHAVEHIGQHEIANSFLPVIRHVETPLVRTAPVPMYLLARLARECGTKVVLTGEGADELFLGYDIFKEAAVRRFCLRQPQSTTRPRLFDRLYPYLVTGRAGDFWRNFFLTAGAPTDPLFSHLPRFLTTSWICEFLSDDFLEETAGCGPLDALRAELPSEFPRWEPDHQAAYLEMVTLLEPYLLSSQSDRVGMAWAVESRFPFLDHRLFEFAANLPSTSKRRGLREKDILRRWGKNRLPSTVVARGKQPYRAPDSAAFFGRGTPDYVEDLLSSKDVAMAGYFRPEAVQGLVRRCRSGNVSGFRENQALVAILSTQAWHHEFFGDTVAGDSLALDRADVVLSDAKPMFT